jgi:hypothetical protein
MNLTITAESSFGFGIELDGKHYWLAQHGGEWRLDGRWVASKTIEWPEALARALRLATGAGLARRTRVAMDNNP